MIQSIAAAVGLLMFNGCEKPEGREVQGNVVFLQGTVTLESGKEGARYPQSATTASKLSVGDQLETSPGAAAAVSLIPGIFIHMRGGTEIVIKQMRVEKQGDAMVNAIKSRLASLRINHGVIRVSLPNVGSGECELRLETDLGTVVAQRGALLSVRLTNETLRVLCVDGEVQWSSARGGRVDEISQGYFQDYSRDDVSNGDFKRELTPVTEDAAAQNDVATALEAAAAFDEFVLRLRSAPPLKSSIPIERRGTFRPP